MSEELTLETLVKKFAKDNDIECKKWMDELRSMDVNDLERLTIVAKSDKKKDCIAQCSVMLGALLQMWMNENFPFCTF
jgi:hypothetical protein